MVPCSFAESNDFLSKPNGMSDEECAPLSILRVVTQNGAPMVVSCWKMTQEELDEVKKTGRVWLAIYGLSMPPAALYGEKPFVVE